MPWTNRGSYMMIGSYFRAEATPANFFAALVTVAVAPVADTNTFGQLTEITAGNGYTSGGQSVARSAVGFDVWTEDDTNDRALVQLVDQVWTASGGPIPASGGGARYMALLDDNVTIASRQVIAGFDLAADRTVSDGQSLTIQNAELRGAPV